MQQVVRGGHAHQPHRLRAADARQAVAADFQSEGAALQAAHQNIRHRGGIGAYGPADAVAFHQRFASKQALQQISDAGDRPRHEALSARSPPAGG
ncbi:hypothetical protein [Pseudoroseomonas sp. WGS1072]|uniref:hypothetical protein n=1 Tax=Roseomonas sp. WGS1072 TaxID=3366816 RepID=UPI003BF36D28